MACNDEHLAHHRDLNGCTHCGGGDAIELAAGLGVSLSKDKAFHSECIIPWGESQGFTTEEMEALTEQAFG